MGKNLEQKAKPKGTNVKEQVKPKEIYWDDIESLEQPFDILYETLLILTNYITDKSHRPRHWRPSMRTT